jgi:protein-S-isoprenylcysteine O-methyltransferase Ste14
MKSKIGSLIGLGIAVFGIVFLIVNKNVLSDNPLTIIIQACSVVLMLWARFTFGFRSFHAAANSTKGELMIKGPYHWLRHPIYAAVIYFSWASVIAYPLIETVAAAFLITVGMFMRMILEEKSLLQAYSDYAAYMNRTKRIIPFIF